jgi:hypothetical protein
MEAAVHYTDSYDTMAPHHLKRTGSTRQYASSLPHPANVHVKSTPITKNMVNPVKRTSSVVFNSKDAASHMPFDAPRRVPSSTSLSSTGYDSNSSPSIKSNRHSIATNNSNDFIAHSISSSSPSSSDEQQSKDKCWVSRVHCYFISSPKFNIEHINIRFLTLFLRN